MTTTPGQIRRQWSREYGDVSVDFVNTKWNRLEPEPAESLASIDDLIAWLKTKGMLNHLSCRRWSDRFRLSSGSGRRVFTRAIMLREALYRIFSAVARGRNASAHDLGMLNKLLAISAGRPMLSQAAQGRFVLVRRHSAAPTSELLGPIALAAATLLSEGDPGRFHRCFNQECGVVFFDRTKNAGRRWCHMEVCGSIFKMRRFRARVR
jgi:predicted RNA-binding Zn ribbon-like protein